MKNPSAFTLGITWFLFGCSVFSFATLAMVLPRTHDRHHVTMGTGMQTKNVTNTRQEANVNHLECFPVDLLHRVCRLNDFPTKKSTEDATLSMQTVRNVLVIIYLQIQMQLPHIGALYSLWPSSGCARFISAHAWSIRLIISIWSMVGP